VMPKLDIAVFDILECLITKVLNLTQVKPFS